MPSVDSVLPCKVPECRGRARPRAATRASTFTGRPSCFALALGIKAVFLVLAVFGHASMWMAVFADMGASLLVVANGLRLLRARTSP